MTTHTSASANIEWQVIGDLKLTDGDSPYHRYGQHVIETLEDGTVSTYFRVVNTGTPWDAEWRFFVRADRGRVDYATWAVSFG